MIFRTRRGAAGVGGCLLLLALTAAACGGDSGADAQRAGDTDMGASDTGANDAATADAADSGAAVDTGAEDTGEAAMDTTEAADVDTPDATTDAEDAAADTADDTADAGPDPIDVPVDAHCENLNPRMCLLPWPSNRWLEPGADTVTGYSVALDSEAVPRSITNTPFDVTPYERFDGFSPSMQIITLFDEPVDVEGLAGFDTIERSLSPTHPTQLIDLETGERVAHWVEIDARAESPEETLFYLRPATRLQANRAYGVALRGLRGVSGDAFVADAVFAALRDGTPTTSEQIEARRPDHEALFSTLEEADVPRDALQLAWSFHTGSNEAIRSRMLNLRDDALERLGEDGLGCTVTRVDEDFRGLGGRRIQGTFTVPWYMDAPQPPATFVLDDDGNPTYQGTEEVAFTAFVPRSLLEGDVPGELVTLGHGLFGAAEGFLSSPALIRLADDFGAVLVGTDWHGMSSKDLIFLGEALADVSTFYLLGENLQQGMINQLTLTRSMLGACRGLPEFANATGESAIDPQDSFFIGGSQGSILGTTYLTLTPDIHRGALIVGGSTFSFMIERSIHYNRFEALLTPFYGSRLVTGTLMVLSQMVWDDAETAAWIGITERGSPRTDPNRYIYLVSENDAQVPNLSSDIAVRTAEIPVLTGSARTPWGIPVEDAPVSQSAYISFGTWDPAPVGSNVSPESDEGGHGEAGFTEPAVEMFRRFFDTGEIIVPCAPDCSAVGP